MIFMENLKNRKTAILITVIVAIAATLFGVHRSLTRLSRELEQMFYDGVYHDGYVEPGIDSHITNCADSSLRLATVLMANPELSDSAQSVLERRRELLDAESISGKSIAFGRLSSSVKMMSKAAENADLTERDKEALSQSLATINGAEAAIRNSLYNETVSFRWRQQSAISSILRAFLPVKAPEMFSF